MITEETGNQVQAAWLILQEVETTTMLGDKLLFNDGALTEMDTEPFTRSNRLKNLKAGIKQWRAYNHTTQAPAWAAEALKAAAFTDHHWNNYTGHC